MYKVLYYGTGTSYRSTIFAGENLRGIHLQPASFEDWSLGWWNDKQILSHISMYVNHTE